jgi:hypothetical protein
MNSIKIKTRRMDRRSALRNLTLGLGYAVAAPTILNIFSSCKSEVETWSALFLSTEEKHIVTHLIDVIIPVTDTPGGLEVNIPQFLDLMYQDIEMQTNQKLFKSGATVFSMKFKEMFDKNILEGSKEEIEKLFIKYFDLSEPESEEVQKLHKKPVNKIARSEAEKYALYNFLFSVRQYAIFGYCTSEKIGEEVLNYDPIPGEYKPCISVEEVGNAWSL